MAVALVSVVFVAGASAHNFAFDTAVTAKFVEPHKNDPFAVGFFKGDVSSSKARCMKDRRVVLKRRESDGSVTVVGEDRTDSQGRWLIQPTSAQGTYFARATKKVLRKGPKHRHTCLRDSSKDVRVK